MTCTRYWRDGIVLVERDQPDPHREACEDCRREHAARYELVRALPMIGGAPRCDTDWQARVWQQITRDSDRKPGGLP